MKIFSGSSNKPLTAKIAKELDLKLSDTEIFIFPDGERRVRILENVVDEDVVVIQTTSPNPDTYYIELFFLVDAAKRSGAKSITAIVPYLGYQRQDHVFREGEAVSLEVIIETLEAVGMDRLITLDLHSIKIPELFKISIVHLSALPIFAEKIRQLSVLGNQLSETGRSVIGSSVQTNRRQINQNPKTENRKPTTDCLLVSPDMGGIRRIKILSELLFDAPFVSVVKDRDLKTGEVKSSRFDRDLGFKKDKKRAIIVDDMISTGRTIKAACDLVWSAGIEEIYVFATHPVFSNDYKNILQNSKAGKIFVTDTIDVPEEKRFGKLEILSVSKMIAEELK
ncbi:MAG: hypothetical protein A2958_02335 [Candidatus Levybacteria bacterium RIFCSPLOWO2_01_FULL_38_13]|nr:MAG: hypothetical protein A2629_03965 [Candidatus Levybacteria bacterium RIFCSPHIGHO2_01_FULL_41_15]OGH35088.1 MAG: hypothetical protein A2958_02335 [Candidatus Levybacteria bacterium RIFCSPLOWO2_01_FULL_38_13]